MKSWQRYAGVFLILIAAGVIQQSVWKLGLLDHGQPGAGFMPFGLGVILAVLAAMLIFTSRGRDEKAVPFWEPHAWVQPLVAIIITVLYIIVFDDLGAITSVVVLVSSWLLFVARKGAVVALGVGLASGLVVWLVFARLLQTPFPEGLLF